MVKLVACREQYRVFAIDAGSGGEVGYATKSDMNGYFRKTRSLDLPPFDNRLFCFSSRTCAAHLLFTTGPRFSLLL